jgi:predicted NACHT family NTPase
VCFSPDGRRLATASFDQTVKVWDSTRSQELLTLKGHTAPVFGVCFSPDGTRLASASADRTVMVSDSTRGRQLLALKGHTGKVSSVCFSPDGTRLASASGDQTVKVWDSTSGKELLTLKGHSGGVRGVCFSPDGTRLASASGDQTVKVWDSTSGKELLTLKGHTDTVFGVCFSPDGTRLASASADMTVRVWESRAASPDALRKRALLEKVDALFSQLLLKERVLRELRKDTWLSKADRRFALEVARQTENLTQLNDAAWNASTRQEGRSESHARPAARNHEETRVGQFRGIRLPARGRDIDKRRTTASGIKCGT